MTELQELVQCDECGREGSREDIKICGDWLGTETNGYSCPDILCYECRTGDIADDTEEDVTS